MLSLIKRNLKIFFSSPVNVILAVLGALISFLLYIVFIKHQMVNSWRILPGAKKLLDVWLMSGTLGITALTTTLSALDQYVVDRERGMVKDFYLTGVRPFQVKCAYFITAGLIGFVLQIILFLMMAIYFKITDGLTLDFITVMQITGFMFLGALFASTFNFLLVQPVKQLKSLSRIEAIAGTFTGFLMGVYLPIGSLPNFAQWLSKCYPGSYLASLYRHCLMKTEMARTFKDGSPQIIENFKEKLGIGYNWNGLTTLNQDLLICGAIGLICLLLIWLLPRLRIRQTKPAN